MLRRLSILLVIVIASAIPFGAFAAEPLFPKAMPVGLVPPGDFKLSARIPGFEDASRNATISMILLPLPAYENIERSIFAKNQAGLTDVKRESFPFANGIGILISARGEENHVPAHKWFLAATGVGEFAGLATLIKVEVPDTAIGVYSDAVIRKALASVTFRVPPTDEVLSLLPFKLDELAGFRVLRVPDPTAVLLIEGPSEDMIKQPYMIVSIGRGAPEDADGRAQFARELMQTLPLRDLNLTLGEAMRIGGYPGYEVRAAATGLDGQPLSVVQWLRFGGGIFLRVIGVVHKDEWDRFFPRFRQVRDGVELKNGP